MDDKHTYDDHHAEHMAGEHESETERDMLDKEPDGTSEDELKNDLQLSVRLALENGYHYTRIVEWVREAVLKTYDDFIKDKQAMCQHHD